MSISGFGGKPDKSRKEFEGDASRKCDAKSSTDDDRLIFITLRCPLSNRTAILVIGWFVSTAGGCAGSDAGSIAPSSFTATLPKELPAPEKLLNFSTYSSLRLSISPTVMSLDPAPCTSSLGVLPCAKLFKNSAFAGSSKRRYGPSST